MRTETPRRLAVGGALVALIALAIQPLHHGLPAGHDTLLHFYRIPVLNALWSEGVAFSRWSPDLLLGYGYPLFQFYPFLSAYLLATLYWVVGTNAPLALTVASALCLMLAGWGAFLVGRHLYGRVGGLVTAAAYVLSPHVLYQVYQRGSLSGALAMGLYPFALWGILRYAARPSSRRAAAAALALAGAFVSHLASALILLIPLAVLGTVAAWLHRPADRRPARRLLGVGAALALGLALAAWFWAPALLGTSLVHYGDIVADVDWGHHFAAVLHWSPWPMAEAANPALSQTPGIPQILLGVAAAVLALVRVVTRRSDGQARRIDILTVWMGVVSLGSVFLAVPASAPLWRSAPLLSDLQFPWRCLDAAALMLPVACGSLAVRSGRVGNGLRVVLLGGLVAMFLNALPYVYPPRHRDLPRQPTLEQAGEYQIGYGTYGLTSWGEYLPIDVPGPPESPAVPGAEAGLALDAKVLEDPLIESLVSVDGGPLRAEFLVQTDEPTAVTMATYWFPGWRARVDGLPTKAYADDQGLLTVSVPAGSHRVEIYWGITPFRALADGISALALVAVVVMVALGRRRGQTSPAASRAQGGCESDRTTTRYALATLALTLALLATKALLLDPGNTPLVRTLGEEGIAGLDRPPWCNVAGELELVGYRLLSPQRLEVYWRTIERPQGDYVITLYASDMRGATVTEVAHPNPGLMNTSRWWAGFLVRDEYDLPLTAEGHPIAYHLDMSVLPDVDAAPLPVVDAPEEAGGRIPLGLTRFAGTAPVGAPDRLFDVVFGDAIRLDGAMVPERASAGEPLEYALWWRCLREVEANYSVFVHLVDAEGNLVATADAQPVQGLYPTSVWRPGEVVADRREWSPDVAPGTYEMRVGLYLLETGERLPAEGPGARTGDYVAVGSIAFLR